MAHRKWGGGRGRRGNLSANADVELQRERCESMEGSERRGQRRVSIRSAVRRSRTGSDGSFSTAGSQLCRPSAGDGAARTHPNVDEGNRAGDEAERGPQQTLLTHNGHQRAITASTASERPHRVSALKLQQLMSVVRVPAKTLGSARGSSGHQFARARRWRPRTRRTRRRGCRMPAPDGIDHAHKNRCIQEASAAGVKGAAFGIAISAPLVYLAHRLSPRFATFTTSTKTGLVSRRSSGSSS